MVPDRTAPHPRISQSYEQYKQVTFTLHEKQVLTKCSGSSEQGAIDASAILVAGVRYQYEEARAGNNQASFEVLAVV